MRKILVALVMSAVMAVGFSGAASADYWTADGGVDPDRCERWANSSSASAQFYFDHYNCVLVVE